MTTCDDTLVTLLLGRPLDAEARAHLASCAACREESEAVRDVGASLARDRAPMPSTAFAGRVLRAATPALDANARRATWRTLWRAVAAALLPLPLIVLLDVWVIRAAHALLAAVLPAPLGLYVVVNYAVLLVLLLALTYGAVPIMVARQLRPSPGGSRV